MSECKKTFQLQFTIFTVQLIMNSTEGSDSKYKKNSMFTVTDVVELSLSECGLVMALFSLHCIVKYLLCETPFK